MNITLKETIVNKVNDMDGYTAKADCLETFELALSGVDKLDQNTKDFINGIWDKINEIHLLKYVAIK